MSAKDAPESELNDPLRIPCRPQSWLRPRTRLYVVAADAADLAVLVRDKVRLDPVQPAPPPVPQDRVVPDGRPAETPPARACSQDPPQLAPPPGRPGRRPLPPLAVPQHTPHSLSRSRSQCDRPCDLDRPHGAGRNSPQGPGYVRPIGHGCRPRPGPHPARRRGTFDRCHRRATGDQKSGLPVAHDAASANLSAPAAAQSAAVDRRPNFGGCCPSIRGHAFARRSVVNKGRMRPVMSGRRRPARPWCRPWRERRCRRELRGRPCGIGRQGRTLPGRAARRNPPVGPLVGYQGPRETRRATRCRTGRSRMPGGLARSRPPHATRCP